MTDSRQHILIVEDNLLTAEGIRVVLEDAGLGQTSVVSRGESVLPWLEHNQADVILMDVRLDGDMTGIEAVKALEGSTQAPIIYLTANQDKETLQQALDTNPAAFISKPFKEVDLISAVHLALSMNDLSDEHDAADRRSFYLTHNAFFIKQQKRYVRVDIEDILWLQAKRMYTEIATREQHYLLSVPMGTLMQEEHFPQVLCRVQRSYAVNVRHVEAFDENALYVNNQVLPLSKSYRKDFMRALNI
ncbi:MAG: LytR/AlgR family response regulator transcription factor [Bacteroidota bacterium]